MGIGPSTKETSMHLFKDPLLDVLSKDPDIDFQGVIIIGTPQSNEMKHLVGQRTATWLEAMATDGVVLSTDGWGNSDIDFANTPRRNRLSWPQCYWAQIYWETSQVCSRK